jgi:hypothetical protein
MHRVDDAFCLIQVRGLTARSIGLSSASIAMMQPPHMSAHARRCASTSLADHSSDVCLVCNSSGARLSASLVFVFIVA